jgi:hypothetical protein
VSAKDDERRWLGILNHFSLLFFSSRDFPDCPRAEWGEQSEEEENKGEEVAAAMAGLELE